MTDNRDPQEIVIAANGGVYIAPVGTTLPADADSPLDTAFVDTGYIDENGVNVSNKVETTGLPAWQSLSDVRVIVTSQTFTAKFALMQWNKATLELAFGGGLYTDHGNGAWEFALPKPGEQAEYAMVIDALDGANKYRIILERTTLSDLGDIPFLRTGASKLPVTVTALAGSDGRAAKIFGHDQQGTGGGGPAYTPTMLKATDGGGSSGDAPAAGAGAAGDIYDDEAGKVYVKGVSAWGTAIPLGFTPAAITPAEVDPTVTPPASAADDEAIFVPDGRAYKVFHYTHSAWTDAHKTVAVPAGAPIYPTGATS